MIKFNNVSHFITKNEATTRGKFRDSIASADFVIFLIIMRQIPKDRQCLTMPSMVIQAIGSPIVSHMVFVGMELSRLSHRLTYNAIKFKFK